MITFILLIMMLFQVSIWSFKHIEAYTVCVEYTNVYGWLNDLVLRESFTNETQIYNYYSKFLCEE